MTLPSPVMHQDALGDVFRVAVRRGSTPVDLTGMTVRGDLYFASTRQTLLLEGSVEEGCACVALTSECYAIPGHASLVVQLQQGDIRHSVLKVNLCITRTATDSILDPGEMLPTLPELLEVAARIHAALEQLPSLDGVSLGGGQRVYCWGDSLTQGYGGNIAAGSNYWHAMSYPQEIGQKCNAINLGVMSENVPTICARIGSNPILLPACTIPGDHTQGVKIGTLADGLPTQGGRNAKVCRYHEAGVNPCWVDGVKCILYRSYSTSTPDTEYYLRRYEDGAAVSVAEGTPLETYGARYYKGGIHIFWMGANYGFSSVQEYLSYLTAAIEHVEADDYLVVYARCFANGFQGETEAQVKAHIIEAVGVEHFIDLLPALKDRGLLYGEVYQWDGTMTNGVPAPLDSGDGLHYSYAGYKAIAGVIWEHLQPLLEVTTGSSGGSGNPGGDDTGGASMQDSGTNVIIIRKSGSTYGAWINGTLLYGNASIGSSMDGADFLYDLTLLIGATPTRPDKVTKNTTTVTVKDLRVYTTALTADQITQLHTEMAAL